MSNNKINATSIFMKRYRPVINKDLVYENRVVVANPLNVNSILKKVIPLCKNKNESKNICRDAQMMSAAVIEFCYYIPHITTVDEAFHEYRLHLEGVCGETISRQTRREKNEAEDNHDFFMSGIDYRRWYHLYLQTDHWSQKRINAFAEYGKKCMLCNSTKSLNIHHRTYDNLGDENNDDLSILCRKHHELFHRHEKLFPPDEMPEKVRRVLIRESLHTALETDF